MHLGEEEILGGSATQRNATQPWRRKDPWNGELGRGGVRSVERGGWVGLCMLGAWGLVGRGVFGIRCGFVVGFLVGVVNVRAPEREDL